MTGFLITREIGIDAAHRVTNHGSKCRNIHGHRYTIQVTCEGGVFPGGEQQGMVLDFGFLKEEMMREIDEPCDHGVIFWSDDLLMCNMFQPVGSECLHERWWKDVRLGLAADGYWSGQGRADMKVYIVPFVPTAEQLARHWYARLDGRVKERTNDLARVHRVTVWETPNCSASYPAVP